MSKVNKKDAPKGCYAVKEEVKGRCEGCCFVGASSRVSTCTEYSTDFPCNSSLRKDDKPVIFKELKKPNKHKRVLKELTDWLEESDPLRQLLLSPQDVLNKIKEIKDTP